MPLPVVAIVGRPNVGKSTLFNALLRRRVAIVDPTAGTTRDRVAAILRTEGRGLELVDTGGLGVVDVASLESHVEGQIDTALREADAIVFVMDVRDGLTPLDRRMAERLRRMGKPVVLAANKADSRDLEMEAAALHSLGLGEPVPVSAQNRVNTTEVLARVLAILPDDGPPPGDGSLRIAIVGRRNAGKSTLLNALAGTPRVIVSEVPGTTRDAVDVRIRHGEKDYTFIDTAGVVRKTRVDDSVEYYAQVRTAEALSRCDGVLFMLDIAEEVGQVDKKVAGMIQESHRPVVVVGNKWDLARAGAEEFAEYFRKTLTGLAFAPVSLMSAEEGRNVWKTIALLEELVAQAAVRIETAEVNRMFQRALEERSPRVGRSRVPRVYYVTQVSVSPPTFAVFVNDPRLFPPDYRRFLENRVRRDFPYAEVPVRLLFRGRRRGEETPGPARARRARR